MYSGPGPASMSLAAQTWDEMAARLSDIAEAYSSVTSTLVEARQDPAAIAVAEAAASHIGWLEAVAVQAQQAASQARAAVDAFDSALAAVVPPSMIIGNRALRISLATTNFLAQNSPEIADTETDYDRMWAQDADAMYTYAAAAEAASTMTPFSSPPPAALGLEHQGAGATEAPGRWSLMTAPEIVSAGRQVMPTIPEALKALSLSPTTTLDACLSAVTSTLSKLSSQSAPTNFAIGHLNSLNKASALDTATARLSRGAKPALAARSGRAASIGALSVPPSWETATIPDRVTRKPLGGDYLVIDPSDLIW
ncbi:hypothetical protein BMG05_18780 [Mycobacterium malmoense]|nr:hypothetical protein BMG05_18780 [Mycobacterium malmoense]